MKPNPIRLCALGALCGLYSACTTTASTESDKRPPETSPNPAAYQLGELLRTDTFDNLVHWQIELENKGLVRANNHTMEFDVPAGCTAWYTREFFGPLLFEYEARLLKSNPPGPNDRVSDLNCFFMATDPRELPNNFFDIDPRQTGEFAAYDAMHTYYVGLGGNANTTSRFRRYIGEPGNRPLLPEHDLSSPDTLLTPNTWQKIQVVACNNFIEYYRDGKRLFSYNDPAPYTHGYFAIRTTWSHLQIKNFTVRRLIPMQPSTQPTPKNL